MNSDKSKSLTSVLIFYWSMSVLSLWCCDVKNTEVIWTRREVYHLWKLKMYISALPVTRYFVWASVWMKSASSLLTKPSLYTFQNVTFNNPWTECDSQNVGCWDAVSTGVVTYHSIQSGEFITNINITSTTVKGKIPVSMPSRDIGDAMSGPYV